MDAHFYEKPVKGKDVDKKQMNRANVETPIKWTFRYTPKSQREPGTRSLIPTSPTLELGEKFVLPLRKTECTYLETYKKFVVPRNEHGSKPIFFHAMGDMSQKTSKTEPKEGDLNLKDEL